MRGIPFRVMVIIQLLRKGSRAMFYVCSEGSGMFGVMDTIDGVVEYYTRDVLLDIAKSITILGVNKEKGTCSVRHIDEYQELEWGKCKIVSFVNTDKHTITVAVEKENKLYSMGTFDCYLSDDIFSGSRNKNGDLEWIFDEGRDNKCAGVCIWLEYSYDVSGGSKPICLEYYFELHPDGKLEVIDACGWDFKEYGMTWNYDKEKDCLVYS